MDYRLMVGLGNPGRDYVGTRHNVGFYTIDRWAQKMGVTWKVEKKFNAEVARVKREYAEDLFLLKPMTFMNNSGDAVVKFCRFFKISSEKVIVIYDDIAFEVGKVKIDQRDGTGGHNGVADILRKLGGGFVRFRVGVGHKANKEMDLKDFVLSHFSELEQREIALKTDEILKCLQLLLDKGAEYAMNFANR